MLGAAYFLLAIYCQKAKQKNLKINKLQFAVNKSEGKNN
jgi:hypothetical protein